MVNKGRKLLALLTMLALIFTYSFSASGLSVYAEEEQGDTNAKAVATEDKAPAAPKEEKAEEPAPAPAPAPAEEVGETGGSEPAANNDQEVKEEVNGEGEVLEEDPDAVLEEVLEEEAAVKAPPIDHGERGLNYNTSVTPNPANNMHPGAGEVEHWTLTELDSNASGCYTWDESTHTLKNVNKTRQQPRVRVTHSIDTVGLSGSTRSEIWTYELRRTTQATVNYYTVGNTRVHRDVAVGNDEYGNYVVWGIPEREGWIFMGWSTRPGDDMSELTPGQTINILRYAPQPHQQQTTLNLYAVWARDTVDLGSVTGKSDTVPYNSREQVLYGIEEGSDDGGYSLFKTLERPHGAQTYYNYYYVKTNDVYAKGKEVGDYETAVSYARVYLKDTSISGGIHATSMFVKVNPGKLTITPRPVTIEVTVTKNGEPVVTKPYTSEQYNVVFDVPSLTTEDEILSSEWDPSWAGQRHDLWVEGTNVGEYYTKVDDTLDDYDLGENVNPDNYEITINVTQGTLKIEAADMKFTVTNYDAVYDGEYHTVTVNTRDLPEGYKLLYSKTGSETEKWTEEAPTWKDVELENTRPGGPVSHPVYVKAICKNFNPVVVEGTVTIRPRPVEVNVDVTSNGESTVTRTYNEQWQSLWFSDIYYDTEDEVLDSEWDPYFSGGGNEYLAKGKEVGEYDTHVKAVATSHTLGGDALAVNYDVTFNVTQGTLVIEAAPMPKFDVTPYDGVFDNEAHTVTVDTSTLPDGFELSYSKTGSETEKWTKDAPEWTYVELTDVRPGGPVSHPVYVKATCDGYKPLIVKSYVKISPREVTVNVERLYNGQNVVEIPFDNESHSYIFDEVSYTTDDEVLDSMKEFKPSYSRKDYKITNKKDVGEYETDVQSEASYYSLMSDRDLNVNFIPTYVVKQGKLIIYAEPATLTFKLNGGNVDGDTEDIVIETETGQTVVIPDAPTKDGYEFQYWKGSKVYPGDEYLVTGDHEFNAIWAKKGSGGGDSDDSDSDGSSTGDTFGLLALFATMSAALLGLLALVVTRRREE